MPEVLVRRDDLRELRVDPGEPAAATVPDGSVQLEIECFGLTANNVTYGVMGDELGYWSFYPAADGWGRIPVWGFGRVTASGVDGIGEGERFHGYFPMASRVTLEARTSSTGLVACSEARRQLPSFYNRYVRAEGPAYAVEHDAANVVLRPLFGTGWLIADLLEERGLDADGTVVVLSASSKTAYAAAFCLRRLERPPRLVGLTSPGNRGFVADLAVYDDVLAYDEPDGLARAGAVTVVDMSGDVAILAAVYEHADVRATVSVGFTHWEGLPSAPSAAELDPAPEFFFAPGRGGEVATRLGFPEFQRLLDAAWTAFVETAGQALEVRRAEGADAVTEVLRSFVDGTADPRAAHVLSL